MSKFVEKVKEEIGKILPPAIFFFITLHIVALERSLMLKGSVPAVNRYPDRPLACQPRPSIAACSSRPAAP